MTMSEVRKQSIKILNNELKELEEKIAEYAKNYVNEEMTCETFMWLLSEYYDEYLENTVALKKWEKIENNWQ